MTSILDHFPSRADEFTPANIQQFTVLQIAKRLHDLPGVRKSTMFAERYSLADVLDAYRKAIEHKNPKSAFQEELEQLTHYNEDTEE